jgi:hypothetical protein
MSGQPNTTTTPDMDLRHHKSLARLTTETRTAVERSAIVLVPDDGFRDYAGPVFPQGRWTFSSFFENTFGVKRTCQ